MKKISKRLLAVLMAVLMVTTVLPLNAVTVFANGQSDLEAAIASYDKMCSELTYTYNDNGSINQNGYDNLKTNLLPAYEAYIAALRTLNNVDAQGNTHYSTDAEMSAAATTLNNALANCKPFTEYRGTAVPVMGGVELTADADKEYYNNVVYAQSDANMDDACDYATVDSWTMITYYPNAVLLDNGKEDDRPVLPVVLGIHSTTSQFMQYFYESIDDFDLIHEHWYGEYNSALADGETRSTAASSLTANNNGTNANPLTWRSAYNDPTLRADADRTIVEAEKNGSYWYTTFTEEVYKPTYASVKNALRYYRSKNTNTDNTLVTLPKSKWMYQHGTSYYAQSTTVYAASYEHEASAIYVLNYEKLIDALKENLKRFSDTGYFSREYIEQALLEGNGTITDILRPLFEALDAATGLNPSKYDYATNIDTAAKKCAADIDAAIDALETAKPDNVLASINNLKRVIREYETKMNSIKDDGKVLSNMAPAYEAYVKANKYANAYDYGLSQLENVLRAAEGEAFVSITASVDAIAKDFEKKTDAMKPVVYGNYNYIPDEAFQGDSVSMPKSKWYNESYKNLVYASKGPIRELSGSGSRNDETAYGLLRLNQEYNTTNLYVPRAVAVYDNDGQRFDENGKQSNSGDFIASVPVMMNYINDYYTRVGSSNQSGSHQLHNYVIRSYYANVPEVQLAGNWLTGTDSEGNIRTQHMLSLANISENSDKYGMKEKLNSVMTSDMVSAINKGNAQYTKGNNRNTYYNNQGYTLFSDYMSPSADSDTNYEYFANRLYINMPTWSDTGVEQFYYEIIDWWCAMTGTQGRNTAASSTTTSSVCGRYESASSTWSMFSGERVATMGHPSICIINYRPVRERIEFGKALLTDNNFNISDYSEGGLNTYIKNMTDLTDVDPYNSKYAYSGDLNAKKDNYISADEAWECAEDIYNLLDRTEGSVKIPDPETIEEGTDVVSAITAAAEVTEDTKTVEEASDDSNYYHELMDTLSSIDDIIAQYDITCLDDKNIYGPYNAAITAAETAMAKVAIDGYAESQETVLGYKNAITTAAADLQSTTTNAPRNQHTARYKQRKSTDRTKVTDYETAEFECTRNTDTHKVSTADMSVYDPLQIAVDTIDYERYTNDNIIKAEEADYDRLTDSVVSRRTVGADGVTPQTMVDNAISEMLTAINTANTSEDNYKYTSKYTVTFNKSVGDNGDISTVSTTENVVYGNTQNLSVSSDEGTVYKWVIETLADDNTTVRSTSIRLVEDGVDASTNDFSLYVQANTRVTAYIMPKAASGKTVITALNPYKKVGCAYLFDSSSTITVEGENGAATEVTVGDVAIKPTDAALTLSTYTNSSLNVSNEISGKKLSEAAPSGKLTIKMNASKRTPEKCTITYNGAAQVHATENELITLESTAENFVAIAVKNGDKYIPVSYGKTMQFYSNMDMEFVDITTTDRINYYANGELISGDNYFYYALKDANKLLPFVYSKMGKLATNGDLGTYSIYSYYANTNNINGSVVKIVEKGTVISRSADNILIDNAGVLKYTAPKSSDYQFSNTLTINTGTKGNFYARGYVKYKYTFVDDKTNEEGVIEAVVYSDVVTSEGLE